MDIFSTLVGASQVADGLFLTAKELRCFIHTVRFTPQEVKRFHRDLRIFAYNLSEFARLTRRRLENTDDADDTHTQQKKKKKEQCIVDIVEQCEEVEAGFDRLLSRFFEDPARQPTAYGLVDRIRWYFRQNQVAGLRLLLGSAERRILLFLQVDDYHDLVAKVLQLDKEKREIPKELRHQLRWAKRQIRAQKAATRSAQKQFQTHLDQTPPSETPLIARIPSTIYNTLSVEQYATQTLAHEAPSIRIVLSLSRQHQRQRRRDSHHVPSSSSTNSADSTGRSSVVSLPQPRRPGPRSPDDNSGTFYSYTTNSSTALSSNTHTTASSSTFLSPVLRAVTPPPPLRHKQNPTIQVRTAPSTIDRAASPSEWSILSNLELEETSEEVVETQKSPRLEMHAVPAVDDDNGSAESFVSDHENGTSEVPRALEYHGVERDTAPPPPPDVVNRSMSESAGETRGAEDGHDGELYEVMGPSPAPRSEKSSSSSSSVAEMSMPPHPPRIHQPGPEVEEEEVWESAGGEAHSDSDVEFHV